MDKQLAAENIEHSRLLLSDLQGGKFHVATKRIRTIEGNLNYIKKEIRTKKAQKEYKSAKYGGNNFEKQKLVGLLSTGPKINIPRFKI